MRLNHILVTLFLSLSVFGAGTFIKGPALVEGFTTTATAAGTTTLTAASETKQIFTGATTQTVVMPDATTLPLGRKFLVINKSTGTVTVNANGGGLLATITSGNQAEIHLRVAGSAAGTWDILSSGSVSGVVAIANGGTNSSTALNNNRVMQSSAGSIVEAALITGSRLLVSDVNGIPTHSTVTTTEAGHLSGVTSAIQTQFGGKQSLSTLTTAGDLYVATASATTTRLGVPTFDGQQLVSDSAATNKIRYKAPLVDNFIKNGDAESVTPIVTYADAAGTRPVDGSGGAPSVSTSISATAPLADTNSFLLTKDAVNRQGQGWSIPFTIPNSMKAKVAQIEVDYIVNSGTFVAGTSSADSDVIWYIYDVTNSTLIEPSSIKLLSNSTTISDKFVTNFQTSATGTSYRLIAHVASTSASAYELKIDNIQVKPSSYVYGTPITDWIAWTPTGSWSTNTTYTGLKRRVGSDGEYRVKIALAGAPTSASLTVNLPSGEVIDTTKLVDSTAGNDFSFGQANMLDSGVANYIGGISYSSTTAVGLNATATGSTYLTNSGAVTQAVQATWGASDLITMFFKVPIVGWSASAQVSDGYDGRQIVFAGTQSSEAVTANVTELAFTSVKDSVTGWTGNTYVAKTAGDYLVSVSGVSTVTGAFAVYRAGSVVGYGASVYTSGAGGAASVLVPNVTAGQAIAVRFTNTGTITAGQLSIHKLSAPTTISMTEKVAFMAEGVSSAAFGSNVTLPFNTPSEDTHGCWNSTNKDCAVPYSGTYNVFCQLRVTGTLTVNQYVDVIIQVDTVTKRESLKYVENTGVSGYTVGTSYQAKLTAGQKIRCVGDTSIASPSLTTGATHTFMQIFMVK